MSGADKEPVFIASPIHTCEFLENEVMNGSDLTFLKVQASTGLLGLNCSHYFIITINEI